MLDHVEFKTAATNIRTGYVIQTPWSRGYTTLEVETVTHERFTSPEGVIQYVVRFTGWELFNGEPTFNQDGERTHRVTRGWGQRATEPLRVVSDGRPRHGGSGTYLRLSGRDDVAVLEAELAEFLAGRAAG